MEKPGSRVIKADGYDILKDPTREQARELLAKSRQGSLRGLRDAAGSLYLWDAFDSYHAPAAKEVGEFGNDFERLLFNSVQLGRFPIGVFFGEEGYGRIYVGREDAISIHEAELSSDEFDKVFK
ncbi:MAG: hypothetical protein Q7V00_12275 [Sulfurimicrobium sp.]|nr:hypothetical protein [Sulfurimicrobium sp.]MDP1704580.1 hypothetical protein [Sulfurimicrobium sp.]MDP2200203.1 hypothetical protein [Sulfurimicrobium sp.]MDP3687256.1 hypothetical protein [Sulfurimicrobium sp.]